MEPAEERFVWTSKLIEAVLELRFKDASVRDAIENAKGNAAKRDAWKKLAARLQEQQGVDVPETKLRRVVSKWQSQHRAWVGSDTPSAASPEKAPSYMPVLVRYFGETQPASKPQAVSPAQERNNIANNSTYVNSPPLTTLAFVPRERHGISCDPLSQEMERLVVKQRRLNPPADNPLSGYSRLRSDPIAPLQDFNGNFQNPQRAVLSITQRLSQIHQDQLVLQQQHFEEQLSLQRKHQAEQLLAQRKQLDAFHAALEILFEKSAQV